MKYFHTILLLFKYKNIILLVVTHSETRIPKNKPREKQCIYYCSPIDDGDTEA